jgi:hypothetical protein
VRTSAKRFGIFGPADEIVGPLQSAIGLAQIVKDYSTDLSQDLESVSSMFDLAAA